MNTPSTTSRIRRSALTLALLAAATAGWAQGKVDARLMQRYGGVLAPECGNYLLPQLKFLGDSLVVQDAGKAVLTGRNVKAVPTYFGASPPPEFETALTSEVAPGEALVFVLYRNSGGLFATVEGSSKVIAALPPAFRGKRVRHCDPNRNAVPGAAPAAQIMPGVLLKDASFKRAYAQALGPLAREPWLMALDGPAQPVEKVQVAGNEYQLVSVCKNHDCYDNNIVVLYGAATGKVYGTVLLGGRATLVGAPPAAVASELQRLWRATYRSAK
jgi:inhibitor of lysozyme (Ivy)